MVPGGAERLMSQMRRGAIEYCVLAFLQNDEMYGFELTRALATDGTVYPLLARLRRDGLVETFWRESSQGPPRRYYRLTTAGEAALEAFVVQWRQFRDTVDALIERDEGGCREQQRRRVHRQ
jgi:PadR family transcriptional regulator PadR